MVPAAPTTDASASPKRELSFGQGVVKQLRAGECSALWQQFSDAMRSALGSEEAFLPSCESLAEGLSKAKLSSEETPTTSVYIARLTTTEAGVLRVTVTGANGKIDGLLVSPDEPSKPAPSKYDNYQTKTPLRVPFTTTWTVFWGGRSAEQNYHVAYPNQHFAYDFVVTKDGKTHAGEGKQNTDYYCFGQEIIAAGAGKVIETITGVADNPPGQMNGKQVTGNHVIIDHGNGEFALYGHLRLGSTKVKEGQVVKQGDEIGRCGNSGNSSEAHLHFHLQDTTKFREAESMPAQFLQYRADGMLVERGEPARGQQIQDIHTAAP